MTAAVATAKMRLSLEVGMGADRILALGLALGLVLPCQAWAFPGSYGREHPAECAAMRDFDDDARAACATREWCEMHMGEDRTSIIACDLMQSKVERQKPRVTLSAANLGADLAAGSRLLPHGMKTAKLALKADISFHLKPSITIRLGIASANKAVMAVSWTGNAAGTIHNAELTPQEIDRLIAALNASDFWRLPYLPLHLPLHKGYVDGENARVTVAMAARSHTVDDAIGDDDAVDLSILVNPLSKLVRKYWPQAPNGR